MAIFTAASSVSTVWARFGASVASMEAGRRIKQEGKGNELLSLLAADPAWGMTQGELEALLDPARFTGRAADQVRQFLVQDVAGALRDHVPAETADVRV